MTEPVRLVIWDLDETFWQGTLTEGGITLRTDTIDIVKELARRGIVSSICSKNDLEQVKEILVGAGVWDHFVLPSINWEPKGARIAALIDAIQLRPSTVMFIDDNPINREEARHIVPELQVNSHEFIPDILSHLLLQGKDDTGLSRLAQYKILEKRNNDAAAASGDITDFLRASNIRVRFDYTVIENLDRAIELINRTNQLNFTKLRLPEGLPEAREALKTAISSHEVRAALVGVSDNYGDHGWCGIYMLHNNGRLLHFAFSCRTLGMQVETWLYRKLGRPHLDVKGEVLVDVKRDSGPIDWIAIDDTLPAADGAPAALLTRVVARGGCDLMPVAHYLGMIAEQVVGEFNENRLGMDSRVDHSAFLRAAFLAPLDNAAVTAAAKLGYERRDFESAARLPGQPPEMWLLSFWTDAAYVLYRHKIHKFSVPFSLTDYHARDARQAHTEKLRASGVNERILHALNELKSSYEFVGFIDEAGFKQNLNTIFSSAPDSVRIVVVGANEFFIGSDSVGHIMNLTRQQNAWLSEVAETYENVTIVNIRDYVRSESEVHSPYHFDRLVYYRLYEHIKNATAAADFAAQAPSWAIHARPDLDAALASANSGRDLSRTAQFLLSEGRYKDALRFARKANDLEPDIIAHKLVYIQAILKSADRSKMADVRQVIESGSHLPGAVLEKLATALLDARLPEEAALVFTQAARAEPTAFHHRHRLANVFDSLARPLDAFNVFQGCYDDGDRNPHMMAHMARLLIRLGRLDEAEAFLETCLASDRNFAPFHEARALMAPANRESRASAM